MKKDKILIINHCLNLIERYNNTQPVYEYLESMGYDEETIELFVDTLQRF